MATIKQVNFITRLLAENPNYPLHAKLTELVAAADFPVQRASNAIEHLLAYAHANRVERAPVLAQTAAEYPEQGIFTVVLNDKERRTLRFRKARQGGLAGQVVVAYLAGPNNEADYQGFATVAEQGARIWNRYRQDGILAEALAFLGRKNRHEAAGKAYALESGHCYRCNRLLTDPISIQLGIGPDCRKMVA